MPAPFTPFEPDLARDLAQKVYVAYHDHPEVYTGKGISPCGLCIHPERIDIDFLILIDANIKQLKIAAGEGSIWSTRSKYWFNKHRDNHIMPLVRTFTKPNATQLPYPREGTRAERDWWHFAETYRLRDMAIARGLLDLALRCQKEMRAIDIDMSGGAPVLKDSRTALPAPATRPSSLTIDAFATHDDNLARAFELSADRKPEPDENERNNDEAPEADRSAGNGNRERSDELAASVVADDSQTGGGRLPT